jgi:hypothetical protein
MACMNNVMGRCLSYMPGTTDPLAPFGVATLAAGGSEGNSEHMAAMRWAQQANLGHWPPAGEGTTPLPHSFGAQLYDLGDPWHVVKDGNPLQPGVVRSRSQGVPGGVGRVPKRHTRMTHGGW